MQQLHSLDATAQRLGVSRFTLYTWARLGRITTVRLGRRRLVSEEEISRLCREGLERCSNKPS